jgi:hypothetical protein
MINLKLMGLGLSFIVLSASAQSTAPLNEPDLTKPSLFTALPEKITVSANELNTLFGTTTEMGRQVHIPFSDNNLSSFDGKIVSTATKNENTVRSMVIRSSNFNGATLTLSSFTNPDGTVSYTGRIISFKHSDAFILQKLGDEYVLVKKKLTDLVNE